MTETRPTRRRWFRFSLRTMLMVVTVACIYLGWAMNWKRERRQFLSRPEVANSNELFQVSTPPAPLLLRILRERGVLQLCIGDGITKVKPETIDTAKRLFPESEVIVLRATQD